MLNTGCRPLTPLHLQTTRCARLELPAAAHSLQSKWQHVKEAKDALVAAQQRQKKHLSTRSAVMSHLLLEIGAPC